MQFYFIGRRAYYSYIICLALKNRNLRKWILRKWTGVVLLLFIFAYEFNHILLNKTSRINTTLVHFTAYMAVLPKSNYADFRNNERKSGTPLYCSYSCTKQINHRYPSSLMVCSSSLSLSLLIIYFYTDHMYFPHEIRAKMIIMSAKLSLIHLCLRFKTIGLIETTLCQLMHKLGGNVAVLFSLNCCNTI